MNVDGLPVSKLAAAETERESAIAAWRKVYDEVEPLRAQHGCIAQRVMRLPNDGNELLVTHDFASAEQAGSFAHDPALREAMGRSGVEGAPRIEIFTDV
jgi:quinol monooxygenase YgiN